MLAPSPLLLIAKRKPCWHQSSKEATKMQPAAAAELVHGSQHQCSCQPASRTCACVSPNDASGCALRRSQNSTESPPPAATSVPFVLAENSSRPGAWNLQQKQQNQHQDQIQQAPSGGSEPAGYSWQTLAPHASWLPHAAPRPGKSNPAPRFQCQMSLAVPDSPLHLLSRPSVPAAHAAVAAAGVHEVWLVWQVKPDVRDAVCVTSQITHKLQPGLAARCSRAGDRRGLCG